LDDKKWKAAIYNYQKAVDLAPNDYHSQYRLALAFSYHCTHEKINCEDGRQLLNELITKFGSNSDTEYLLGIINNR
jgi:outer membrane protein assembly factor BamD (BamD/ComL family)